MWVARRWKRGTKSETEVQRNIHGGARPSEMICEQEAEAMTLGIFRPRCDIN